MCEETGGKRAGEGVAPFPRLVFLETAPRVAPQKNSREIVNEEKLRRYATPLRCGGTRRTLAAWRAGYCWAGRRWPGAAGRPAPGTGPSPAPPRPRRRAFQVVSLGLIPGRLLAPPRPACLAGAGRPSPGSNFLVAPGRASRARGGAGCGSQGCRWWPGTRGPARTVAPRGCKARSTKREASPASRR